MALSNLGFTALLLGVLVTVHELGHFLVAKALNVKVLRFSIGFGPRIFGFTRGETEYRVAWIPLGGYVKMAGEQPYEELSPEEAKRGFLAQAPWKRALIVAAGPVFNLVFPVLVFFFVYLGTHTFTAPVVGRVEPGSPAAMAQLEPGDRILAVDDTPIRTFDELRAALQPRYEQVIRLTLQRGQEQRVVELTPLRRDEKEVVETVPRGLIGIQSVPRSPTLGVPAGSAAEAAGLRTFDRILSINGEPVKSEAGMLAALKHLNGELKLSVLRSTPIPLPGAQVQGTSLVEVTLAKGEGSSYSALGGAEIPDLYVVGVRPGSAAEKAGLRRGDKITALNDKPIQYGMALDLAMGALAQGPFRLSWRSGAQEKSAQLHLESLDVTDAYEQTTPQLDAGFSRYITTPAESPPVEQVTLQLGAGEALAKSLNIVPQIIRQTAMVIPRILTDRTIRDNVGGPVMLYNLASKTAEQGTDSFLQLMAVISINLGLMNLLPIPILDGFHLLAAFWEGVRRRPIPLRAREVANMVGLALLLVLMVKVFYNDITRYILQ